MPPGRHGERGSERLHPGRQRVRHVASSCIWHAHPRIHVPGEDSTIVGPVRIRYDITFDSITKDSTTETNHSMGNGQSRAETIQQEPAQGADLLAANHW